jgi:hypothetical protein
MTRGEPWITPKEKEEIKQVVIEQRMFGYTNEESTKIASERISKKYKIRESITKKTYENIKVECARDNELTEWITVYAKVGYLDAYREWVDTMDFVKQRALRLLAHETNKPIEQQSVNKVNSLSRNIRETVIVQSSLGLGAPMLLQLKNAIDKGFGNEFIESDGVPKRLTKSGEDDGENLPSDEFAA